MDECALLVKRGGDLVRISAFQDKQGQWRLEMDVFGILAEGFPSEVTLLPESQRLQVFSIRTVGIRTIPETISNLANVTELRLTGSLVRGDLEGFPLAVCHLHKLTHLSLSRNKNIKQMPTGVCGKLKRLRRLNMDKCGLTFLPDDLDELSNLEKLDLSGNRLFHLCDGFKNMAKLKEVLLSGNHFVCLEEEFPFDSLVNIKRLSMSSNNMKTLPGGIEQLVKLKRIDLDGNKLECLPKEFCNLPSDATVHLHNNPLSVPPLSVCESGIGSIKSYFQSLEGSSAVERTRRAKLKILGKSRSGKSSLIRAIQLLLEGRVQDACVQEEDRTIGIDQHVVSLKDVDLVVLDSGGQRSYSPINQLFTSNNCLVIITADAQQYTIEADGAFKHLIQPYFQRVYDYVNTAVILPVITKADLVPSKQFQQISTDLVHKGMGLQKEREELMETYRKQNPEMSAHSQKIAVIGKKETYSRQTGSKCTYDEWCISKVMCTSAKASVGFNELISYLNDLLKDRSLFPGLDTLLPSSWVKSEDQLQSMSRILSPPISSLPDTCHSVIPFGVSPHNAQGLLSYLHTVGSICHYDRHPSLRNHVFLNPQFLIDLLKALYHHNLKSILTVDSLPLPERHLVTQRELESMLNNLSKNGIASIKLLRLIWAKFGFEEEHDNLMIKLLVSFNFAYIKCENDKVMETVYSLVEGSVDLGCDDLVSLLEQHDGELLLPWFLSDNKPDDLLPLLPSDQILSVCLIYSFASSLPEGLFERVSARCHRHSNSTRHWLTGVDMEYAGCTALLQCDSESAEIVLSASIVRSMNAHIRLWHIVCRLIRDIESEIKETQVVQRYMSTSQEGIESVGADQDRIQLHEEYPAFQLSAKDPVACDLSNHKMAVVNAHAFIKEPLRKVISPENGRKVTEEDARNVAFEIKDAEALSRLRLTLGVKKVDITGSTNVCEEALDVINKWRQSSSHACICVFRDALHKARLSDVDDTVFGRIVDQTLTKAEAKVTQISIPTKSDSQSKDSQISGSKIFKAVLKYGVDQWFSIGLELGLSNSQIDGCTFDKPSPGSKLQAIVQKKVEECGVDKTEKSLLIACERIRPCVQEQDRTIGIDQHMVSLKDVDLVVLDSGGQRSYSPINQLFTSNELNNLEELSTNSVCEELADASNSASCSQGVGDAVTTDSNSQLTKAQIDAMAPVQLRIDHDLIAGNYRGRSVQSRQKASLPEEEESGSSSQPAEQHSAEDHKSLYVPWGAVEETITLSSELCTIKSKLPAVKSAEPVQPYKCARIGPDWDYDVFLCHEGRSSKEFATKIFNALADKQIRAFLDKECFRGSQTVPSTLAKSIYKSHFVMVILAPEFISKEHPAYEYQLAMERHNSDDLLLGSSSQPAEQHSAEDHKSFVTQTMEGDMTKHIDDKQIMAIAAIARNKWEEIGRNLGFETYELSDYEQKFRDEWDKSLRAILVDWKASEESPTIGKVIGACKDAKVEPAVRQTLRKLESVGTSIVVPVTEPQVTSRVMDTVASHSLSNFDTFDKIKGDIEQASQSHSVIRKTFSEKYTEGQTSDVVKVGDISRQLSNLSAENPKSLSEAGPISQLILVVSPEGGSACVGDMSLYVPRGAVEETITLSCELYIIKSKLPAVKSAEDEYVFSPVLSLYPHGYQFRKPVLVRCLFNAVPGGWQLTLLRRNCQESEPLTPWKEIVNYNTKTGEVSTRDCSYDISSALLSIDHFCDHCWIGKPIANYIWGQKQLQCSAFGYVHNKQLTIEVIAHDYCNDLFEAIRCKQLQKELKRHYFDGPKHFAVDQHNDVCFNIQPSQSWVATEQMQKLPPKSFWSSLFGNEQTIVFDLKLRPSIRKEEVDQVVVMVVTFANANPVKLTVAPPLDKLFPITPIDTSMSVHGSQNVARKAESTISPSVKRSTLISHLLSGSQPHGCLKEVATLMDEGDVMGDDWRRLWAELVKRPLEETIVKEVKAQPGGPTLYTLKLWVRGSGNPSEATIGSLIETLSKVYRNDVAEVLQKYIQVYTGDVSTEHGKDFVMGSNSSLHPDHSVSDENQKTRLEAVSSDRVVATPEGSVVVNGRQDVSSVSSPSKETTCVSALILAIIFILGVLVYQYNNSVEGSIKTSIPAIMFILGVLFSWGIYQYNNSVEGSTKTILISGIMFILVVLFSRGIYQYNNSVEGSTKTSCLSQQPKQLATRDELYKTKHIDDKQILAIAAVARNKWKEIAINLGFETYELSHYEYKFGYGWDKRLRAVLVDWKASEENPTIGKVLEACKEAKVETAVRRALRKLIGDA